MQSHSNHTIRSFFVGFPGIIRFSTAHAFRRGIVADVVCYGAAASACEKGQRWSHALQLLAAPGLWIPWTGKDAQELQL